MVPWPGAQQAKGEELFMTVGPGRQLVVHCNRTLPPRRFSCLDVSSKYKVLSHQQYTTCIMT